MNVRPHRRVPGTKTKEYVNNRNRKPHKNKVFRWIHFWWHQQYILATGSLPWRRHTCSTQRPERHLRPLLPLWNQPRRCNGVVKQAPVRRGTFKNRYVRLREIRKFADASRKHDVRRMRRTAGLRWCRRARNKGWGLLHAQLHRIRFSRLQMPGMW